MSELELRERRVTKARRENIESSVALMKLARVGTMCLAALIMTVLWAAILYGGSWLIGSPIAAGILLRILAVIFCVCVFGLGLAMSAGGGANDNDAHRGEDL
jgi:hypothetical protein